jgi:hypothetical protein
VTYIRELEAAAAVGPPPKEPSCGPELVWCKERKEWGVGLASTKRFFFDAVEPNVRRCSAAVWRGVGEGLEESMACCWATGEMGTCGTIIVRILESRLMTGRAWVTTGSSRTFTKIFRIHFARTRSRSTDEKRKGGVGWGEGGRGRAEMREEEKGSKRERMDEERERQTETERGGAGWEGSPDPSSKSSSS